MSSTIESNFPLIEPLQVPSPLAAFRAIAHLPHAFLLHSAVHDRRSRWSFFGADPFAVFRADEYDSGVELWRRLAVLDRRDEPTPSAVPFTGGMVGYWSYDFGRRLETLPTMARDEVKLPDVLLAFYDVIGAYDHERRQAWLFSSGLPLFDAWRRGRAEQRLDQFQDTLASGRRALAPLATPSVEPIHAASTLTPANYRSAVERIQRHIADGDLYQANLSQRWRLERSGDDVLAVGIALAEALEVVSPAPFSSVITAPDHVVVSASPERFLRLENRRVETRPIKGTRPRSSDPVEDARLAAELLASAKDRAENVMIVDVLRNDLGRVCGPGTIETPALCELESFAQVHHLTSTVTGTLRAGTDAFDLLHACFPGGSITGAPKIRAMEILDQLEPVRRHIYTGAIGYVGWNGDADWSIAIRTALVTADGVRFAAGGGITADSDAEEEYRECLHKAEGMRRALERVFGPIVLDSTLAGATR